MPLRSRSRVFQCHEELAAVGLDAAQLVELGVVAGGDHAAVAHHRSGFGMDRGVQHRERLGGDIERSDDVRQHGRAAGGERSAELGQAGEALAQRGEITRTGAAQRDAGGDAVDVGDTAQGRAHRGGDAAVATGEGVAFGAVADLPRHAVIHVRLDRAHQLGDRGMPRRRLGALAQRVVQGMAQPARTHAGGAGVEQREQGGRRLAAQGLGQFQVAPGGGVQAQIFGFALDSKAGDVGERLALGGLGVVVECGGGAERDRQIFYPKAGQVAGAEVRGSAAAYRSRCRTASRPAGAGPGRAHRAGAGRGRRAPSTSAGRRRSNCACSGVAGALHETEVAVGEVQPCQPEHAAVQVGGEQQRVAAVVEQRGRRSGCRG
jgi:hypothetical protein